ncbi:MAG: DUF2950 domain-containing protein [Polyangiaceae bacterium]|nr:DUF2950 domain-containing protein [Polyangiaceae bacterium]
MTARHSTTIGDRLEIDMRNEEILSRPRLYVSLAFAIAVSGCAGAAYEDRTQYASPELATKALVTALREEDDAKLRMVLGPKADYVLFSGDAVADRNRIQTFLDAYAERHELDRESEESFVLVVGDQKWPMPIPLVRDDEGWVFATEEGADEMLSRRIGQNELDAVQVLLAISDAQREYAQRDPDANGLPDYAPKLISDTGKKNGLYWGDKEGEARSPIGRLLATASSEGYVRSGAGEPMPFHGYYYRLLEGQGPNAKGGMHDYVVNGYLLGGFGIVAWPASVGNSGVMTFIVNQDGNVYQKYLGPRTDEIARKMTRFDPDKSWRVVK